MEDFISEDDLNTFEGWLKNQGIVPTAEEALQIWKPIFEESRARRSAIPKVGLMELQTVPGEHRYAVAVREGSGLWLSLWVRRSRKGEFFIMAPRGDRDWDVHASYHLDGTSHMKSYNHKVLPPTKRQPLTGAFRGTENLGAFSGYGPKSVGAICDPKDFSRVVEVPAGVLGPRDGMVAVDLVEPGCAPTALPWSTIVRQEVLRDTLPWVVITIGSCAG